MKLSDLFESRASIDDFERKLRKKYSELDTLFLSQTGNTVRVSSIIVNRAARNQGIGSKVMQDIIDFADKHQYRVTLTPGSRDDHHGTTSTARLIKFYKTFGFVQNKGQRKDFTISDSMYREPN